MKTYTIHLIRHALTQGNIEGRYIGQTDEELCQEGLNQLEVMKRDYNYPVGDVVFTVGKGARATKTAHDGASFASNATVDLVSVNRALTFAEFVACFKNGNLQALVFLDKFVCGKNSARTSTDNDYVVFHTFSFVVRCTIACVFATFLRDTANKEWCAHATNLL